MLEVEFFLECFYVLEVFFFQLYEGLLLLKF